MSDADVINGLLAEQAKSVIAGVLKHPDVWGRVSELVGDLLAPTDLRADKWTTTAWRGLSEILEVDCSLDVLLLREKMQGLASLGRPELLEGWSREADERLRAVVQLIDFVGSAPSVVDAAERLVTTHATSEFTRGLAAAQRELSRDPLANPFEALSDLQTHLQTTCRRTARVERNNAAAETRQALARSQADVLPTGFALDPFMGGGQDFGEITMFGARTGVGKSVFLQAQARNQIFPASAEPMHNALQRLRVNTEEDRPHILVVSCENLKRMFFERLACDMLDIHATDMRQDRQKALEHNNADPSRVHQQRYVEALDAYGRLTVIDEDDLPSVSPSAIGSVIDSWADAVLADDADARMLVLVDYWQRTEPDDDQVREQRTRQLELAAKRLKACVRGKQIALTLAVQLNDSFENAEPTRGDIRDSRGGNNEAGNIWLGHRWSNAQQARLRERFTGIELQQRLRCMSVFSDKGRNSGPGWRAVLAFDGAHYRITNEVIPEGRNAPINWLRDYDTLDMVKPDKRVKDAPHVTLGVGDVSSPFS